MKDGRYHYLETGSLISIHKNIKDILIPSEEMKIQVYPMDYEEFCDAVGFQYELLHQIYLTSKPIGQATNRKLRLLAKERVIRQMTFSTNLLTLKQFYHVITLQVRE